MRIFWTAFWALLLSFMAAYVLTNMEGSSINFAPLILMTVLFTVSVVILAEGLITEDS
ncbi:DUF2929 family protein [Thalassobacillus sp. CUG 92003]|uniref:DUF2929 family protein n=1 Tax=Thalassobacillus sp. CUG 92003 TaxID=2736641 RepID=UPI0015E73406|nr:DUF2929 family protein [Thalassobacillus sp. CUG 92003]